MKVKLQSLKNLARNAYARGAVIALSAGPVLAQETATAGETAIADAKTVILALIAVGGAALIAVALAKVGFTAAAKWIGRLGSKG